MKKTSRNLCVILMAVLLCLSLSLTSCGLFTAPAISVSFEGNQAQSVEKDGSVTAPDFTPADSLQVFLGWSTEQGKTSSADVMFAKDAAITYDQLAKLASENEVKLYPVLSTKKTISLTWNGSGDNKTTATLVEGETPTLTAPGVTLGAKQEFLGWANTEGATDAQLAPDALLSYANAAALATDGSLTLYPVIKTYDLVVGVINVKFSVEDEEGNILHDVNYYVGLVKADFAAAHPEASVLYRIYDGKTAECGAQILADGDVDVVMAGNNVDNTESGAGLTVIAKAKLAEKYNPDGIRRGALIVNSELALDMYAMLIGKENKNIEITVGANATIVNSALGNEVDTSGVSDPNGRVLVGWARTANAAEAEITSTTLDYAAVEALATEGKITLYPVYGAFDLIVGIINVKFTSESDPTHDVNYYINLVKEDFKAKHPDAVVLYRIYDGSVAECGAQILADGDVDVVLAGNNVDAADGAGLTVIAKAKLAEKYNPDTSRRGALIVNSELALDMYAMLVGKENANIEITLGDNKTVVNSALGNEADTSAISAPEGKKLIGWALAADATEALIPVADALKYANVKAHATEGKITLYPVFEDIPATNVVSIAVAIWAVNGENIYASDEEIAALETGFDAFLASKGKTADVRYDKLTGKTAAYPNGIEDDVLVVLSGKNVDDQCGTTGKTKVTGVEFSSTRYYGIYADRMTADQKVIVDLLLEYLAPAASTT